jgi:hypothetical protein
VLLQNPGDPENALICISEIIGSAGRGFKVNEKTASGLPSGIAEAGPTRSDFFTPMKTASPLGTGWA